MRNKTVISKHVFAGNQRIASTVSMKNNCGTVTEQNTMYFHPDHLGSSSYVTDKKGNFFEMIEYLPYGETLYDEAATVDKTAFRFTGHEKDDETGFYYCHARYYDPKVGKFLTPDDRIDGLFSSAGQNMYMYCHGNPIMFNDPDGHGQKEAEEVAKKSIWAYQDKPAIDRQDYLKSYEKKLNDVKSKNQDKIVWTSPQRTSKEGYPEWAYNRDLRAVFDDLMLGGYDKIIDQIGEAYIKAIYDNPKDYGDGKIYQLPEGTKPLNTEDDWKHNPVITNRIGKDDKDDNINNIHFKNNGEIHWDPNDPTYRDAYNMLYNSPHVAFDYYRLQTPKPEPIHKPVIKLFK